MVLGEVSCFSLGFCFEDFFCNYPLGDISLSWNPFVYGVFFFLLRPCMLLFFFLMNEMIQRDTNWLPFKWNTKHVSHFRIFLNNYEIIQLCSFSFSIFLGLLCLNFLLYIWQFDIFQWLLFEKILLLHINILYFCFSVLRFYYSGINGPLMTYRGWGSRTLWNA